MAINTLEYAKIFMQTLDKQMLVGATSGWMEANAGQVKYSGGNEVKIPMISTSGLGDYDRDEGFKRGAVTLSYQTMTMTQDRGRTFHLDAMDVDETNFIAAAGNVMGEFQRTQVIPEIDAYRYSKIAALAEEKGRAEAQAVTEENVLSLLLADIAKIRDEIGGACYHNVGAGYAAFGQVEGDTEKAGRERLQEGRGQHEGEKPGRLPDSARTFGAHENGVHVL